MFQSKFLLSFLWLKWTKHPKQNMCLIYWLSGRINATNAIMSNFNSIGKAKPKRTDLPMKELRTRFEVYKARGEQPAHWSWPLGEHRPDHFFPELLSFGSKAHIFKTNSQSLSLQLPVTESLVQPPHLFLWWYLVIFICPSLVKPCVSYFWSEVYFYYQTLDVLMSLSNR